MRVDETYRELSLAQHLEKIVKRSGEENLAELAEFGLNWHPSLPAPPPEFPEYVELALNYDDAEFIRGRIQQSFPDSLLAFLVSYSDHSECDDIWQHPRFADFRPEIKELLAHARLFSDVMYGSALLYNLQLADRRSSDDLKFDFEEYWEQWLESLELAKIY